MVCIALQFHQRPLSNIEQPIMSFQTLMTLFLDSQKKCRNTLEKVSTTLGALTQAFQSQWKRSNVAESKLENTLGKVSKRMSCKHLATFFYKSCIYPPCQTRSHLSTNYVRMEHLRLWRYLLYSPGQTYITPGTFFKNTKSSPLKNIPTHHQVTDILKVRSSEGLKSAMCQQ